MSYKCKECSCTCEAGWCKECNVITEIEHTCEWESNRVKDFQYGDNGWTTRLDYSYCDECGSFVVL